MRYKAKLIDIITTDVLIMKTLAIVKELKLNDYWVDVRTYKHPIFENK